MSMDLMEWIVNIRALVVSSHTPRMMSAHKKPLLPKGQMLLDGALVCKLRSVVDSAEFVSLGL